MSKKDLSRKPQNITKELWYYEEKGGFNIVHEIRESGRFIRTDQILISWRKILNSVKRLNK